MNTERIQLLIEALRSGKYKQTQGRMRREDCYCVAGVACDVFRKTTKIGRWNRSKTTLAWRFGKEIYGAPHSVLEWFGLSEDETETIMIANDDKGSTFGEIADLLEGMINVTAS